MHILEDEQTMNNVAIGQRIRDARKKNGYSSFEMAALLYLSKDQYSRIECGRSRCKSEHLFLLSRYLNVSVDYLLFGKVKQKIEFEIYKLLEGKREEELLKIKAMIELMCMS